MLINIHLTRHISSIYHERKPFFVDLSRKETFFRRFISKGNRFTSIYHESKPLFVDLSQKETVFRRFITKGNRFSSIYHERKPFFVDLSRKETVLPLNWIIQIESNLILLQGTFKLHAMC